MAGLYFHIPFCKRICAYCDFFRTTDLSRTEEVAAAMHRELEAQQGFLGDRTIRTVYFGGGTPSLLPTQTLGGLIRHTAELYDCSQTGEITAEANPDDLTPAYLDGLLSAGFNRLSIGIQSFDDDALRLMNRRHTAAQAADAVRNAQHAGFENLTIDLIFGIPGFGPDTLRHSLEYALSLGIQHISAYHLTIEPGTRFGTRAARGEFSPVDENISEAEFLLVHDTLTSAGFEHYEVSNYALPDFRARHNAAYWSGEEYLGIGPAAHSYNGKQRHWAVNSVPGYIAGAPYEEETLSECDRFNEYVMTSLRTAEGIDTEVLTTRFGAKRCSKLLSEAEPFIRSGDLHRTEGHLVVPAPRFMVSDAVIGALFETQQNT